MYDERLANVNSLEFSSIARNLKSSGKKITSLGLGEPIWTTPQIITSELSFQISNKHFGYSSPLGNQQLRDNIINAYLPSGIHQSLANESLLITQGAKGALSLALESILKPGDSVAVVEPCYVSYIPQIFLAAPNTKVKSFVPKYFNAIDLDQIDSFLTEHSFKCLLISSPSNPTGYTLSFRDLSLLQSICKRHNVYLVVDEVYSKLYLGDHPEASATTLISSCDNVIVVNSLSKTYSLTSWRIGFLMGPSNVIRKAAKILQHELTCIPEFLQVSASKFIEVPVSWLEENLSLLRHNLSAAHNNLDPLRKIGLISYTNPDGGMFIFVRVNIPGFDSDVFCSKLIESTNIAITPGKTFGHYWSSYLRISLSCEIAKFSEAISEFTCFLSDYSSDKHV